MSQLYQRIITQALEKYANKSENGFGDGFFTSKRHSFSKNNIPQLFKDLQTKITESSSAEDDIRLIRTYLSNGSIPKKHHSLWTYVLLELIIQNEDINWAPYTRGTDIDEQIIEFNQAKDRGEFAFMPSDKHRSNSIVFMDGEQFDKLKKLGTGTSRTADLYQKKGPEDAAEQVVVKRQLGTSTSSIPTGLKGSYRKYENNPERNEKKLELQKAFFESRGDFRVHTYGGKKKDSTVPYVTTEPYLEGTTLSAKLKISTPEECLTLLAKTLTELNKMHEDSLMSHGDIGNLTNALVSEEGEINLCDLEISQQFENYEAGKDYFKQDFKSLVDSFLLFCRQNGVKIDKEAQAELTKISTEIYRKPNPPFELFEAFVEKYSGESPRLTISSI
ncbi:Uncharacterised protein [Legionella wadsworthii]|uniref:Uncharacterized protein n=1 Tax=Legionella wadsworthii TaxID=28088 RepID=A0A378LY26_9GAMM|nr:hypothetical protein [Legionella wadsworthii]STY31482.1 Uncharacterised protein [Legionella wadsworthii]